MFVWVNTHAHYWRCDETKRLDAFMSQAMCDEKRVVSLHWSAYSYEEDCEHMIRKQFAMFCAEFVDTIASLNPPSPMLVLTDSTIAHYDTHERRASDAVEAEFAKRGIRAHVDAVCGSGFAACAEHGTHVLPRLKRGLREHQPRSVVLMIGWNDVGRADVLLSCATRVRSSVENYCKHGVRA